MRIALCITCYNDTLFPQTGRAVVRVLERLGHTVDFPMEQTCCGQMHCNTGYRPEAYALAKRFVATFREAEAVCIPSSSCAAMVRDLYPALAEEHGDGALLEEMRALAPRVFEFTELLVDRLGVVDVGATFPHKVAYHASCHGLRSLQLGDKPHQLLRNVRGLDLRPVANEDRCCGFGGTFAVKNAEVSTAMGSEKVQSVLNSGAEVCTACDNSCLMHIGGLLHRQYAGVRTMHIAEILAEAGN
jgi:L-lactate dehydrogenase complex protein LldE